MSYTEDDFLPLSGLQHFSFCRRQWALIHIEQQWRDNLRTVEGNILHERAHDETIKERSRDKLTMRGLRISSSALGISGACDVVEFVRSESGARLSGEDGFWQNSVFECNLDAAKLELVKHKLEKLIDPKRDSLRFYNLGNNYSSKVLHLGIKAAYDPEDVLMI